MITTKPKFSQQTFDHMRRLIHELKNRASTQNDSDTLADADLLDALLLRFVEDLIMEGSINVASSKGPVPQLHNSER